jgi:hypothetical protein
MRTHYLKFKFFIHQDFAAMNYENLNKIINFMLYRKWL